MAKASMRICARIAAKSNPHRALGRCESRPLLLTGGQTMRVKETPMPFDEAIRQLASRLGHESLPIAAGNLERMLRQSEVKQSEVSNNPTYMRHSAAW